MATIALAGADQAALVTVEVAAKGPTEATGRGSVPTSWYKRCGGTVNKEVGMTGVVSAIAWWAGNITLLVIKSSWAIAALTYYTVRTALLK
ncbi:MAG: hypothetical protein HY814_07060 [Candidatus Riflebacteria bacterium]|nr:hypothetical protein [Candidatus Riflebacteria bacterium]